MGSVDIPGKVGSSEGPGQVGARRSTLGLKVSWLLVAVVVDVARVFGSAGTSGPPTQAKRIAGLEAVVRCPSCDGLSIGQSSAQSAFDLRQMIATEVRSGESDSQITSALVARYGQGILLKPPTSGLAGLVWLLPVIVWTAGIAIMVVFFLRRARSGLTIIDPDDAAIVQMALDRDAAGGGIAENPDLGTSSRVSSPS